MQMNSRKQEVMVSLQQADCGKRKSRENQWGGITFRGGEADTHKHTPAVIVKPCGTGRCGRVQLSQLIGEGLLRPQRLARCLHNRNIIITKHLPICCVHTPLSTCSHEVPHSWHHLAYFVLILLSFGFRSDYDLILNVHGRFRTREAAVCDFQKTKSELPEAHFENV